MDFENFFGPPIDLRGADASAVIVELIDHLIARKEARIEHRDQLIKAVLEREKGASTAFGNGVAIPHADSEFVDKFVCAIGRSRSGAKFEASDGKPVNIVILFIVRKGEFQTHLTALGNIAKAIQSKSFQDWLWG